MVNMVMGVKRNVDIAETKLVTMWMGRAQMAVIQATVEKIATLVWYSISQLLMCLIPKDLFGVISLWQFSYLLLLLMTNIDLEYSNLI